MKMSAGKISHLMPCPRKSNRPELKPMIMNFCGFCPVTCTAPFTGLPSFTSGATTMGSFMAASYFAFSSGERAEVSCITGEESA